MAASALLDLDGLRLTREVLETGGHTYRLKELTGFRTRRESPSLSLPLLVAGLGATLAVPVLLARPGSGLVYAALTLVMLLVLAAMAYLAGARDTYGLVLRTARGDEEVFRTRDAQGFARVVEALDEALVRRVPVVPLQLVRR